MIDALPILIAGPTASGKSALALALAERLGGAIINADSMQVYRELCVLTARPSAADEARVPHFLYGHVPSSDAYSAGRFVCDVQDALARVRALGLRPIVTGGTGLYFKALLDGLSPIPTIDPAVRAHWRAEAVRVGAGALHEQLAARDPVMAARLQPSDAQRVVRALEVLDATGRSLAQWQSVPGTPVMDAVRAIKIALRPPREVLRARADARFAAMVYGGGMEEALALSALQLSPELPAMRAIGVAPLLASISATISLDEAIALGQAETRQYIKRQDTWLRSNMITWNELMAQQTEELLPPALAFIQSYR